MIDRQHALPVKRQAELVGIGRGTAYSRPVLRGAGAAMPRPTHPFIPMARGWVYLVAVLDRHSRRVLSHRVSITMRADFRVAALEDAITRYGAPEIVNADQGRRFTRADFVAAFKGCPDMVYFNRLAAIAAAA
jgi:transposase InsO family protein